MRAHYCLCSVVQLTTVWFDSLVCMIWYFRGWLGYDEGMYTNNNDELCMHSLAGGAYISVALIGSSLRRTISSSSAVNAAPYHLCRPPAAEGRLWRRQYGRHGHPHDPHGSQARRVPDAVDCEGAPPAAPHHQAGVHVRSGQT